MIALLIHASSEAPLAVFALPADNRVSHMKVSRLFSCCMFASTAVMTAHAIAADAAAFQERPNVVLLMCDDLGYGDTGFNGNQVIQTPHLDSMARKGVILSNFHAGAAVCSPTRATCLTGRHHYRYGIWSANRGHLPKHEVTLASTLKECGYTTGHFGKWHLGTLSKEFSAKGPRRRPDLHYAPPWERDYDRSFVTESAVATWNPTSHERYVNNPYWDNGKIAKENLEGCDSRIIMDRVLPFVTKASHEKIPFLAVIWFHAPHVPVVAGPKHLAMYAGLGDAAHYYGCITAMDEQVGRLHAKLNELDETDNTLVLFCSDNGPEGKNSQGLTAGVTGGLRGRKRSVYEGGVRVPAFAYWPGTISPGRTINTPLSTLDYLPTVQALLGYQMKDNRPIDGADILPILMGNVSHRPPIPFRVAKTASLIDAQYKLVIRDYSGETAELYDLNNDRKESHSIADQYPQRVNRMTKLLQMLETSVQKSHSGVDYPNQYEPTETWVPLVDNATEIRPNEE